MTEAPACRHEYIKIFQRKLKGLERRMVSTRAYLPLGFKTTDFGHLGEGSYCFCTNCRARLYPRRTQQEKLAARAKLAQEGQAADLQAKLEEVVPVVPEAAEIHVEELELEQVDFEDIHQEGVKLGDEDEPDEFQDDEEL